jgi:hypothetical protein
LPELATGNQPNLGLAAHRSIKGQVAAHNPDNETVELFSAIESRQLEARFIPKNSKQGRVYIENKTARALNVRLPEAFGGEPILAQFGPGGNGNGLGAPGNGGNQNLGGGINGNRGNNGLFNIPAEKVGELKVTCVCLEHGKAEPRAAVPYRLVPIGEVTSDPVVQALVATLSSTDRDQAAAQAAVWHLANGMSWVQLAAERIEHLAGPSEPYFSAGNLAAAMKLVESAEAAAHSELLQASLSQR